MGTLTIFLWPQASWIFDIEKFVAVAAALLAWLWSEMEGGGEPHPHDVALFQKLIATIGANERLKMAEHNMGNSFPIKTFDGSGDVVETWKGAAFEFQDRGLNDKWLQVRQALDDFTDKLNRYTGAMPNNPALATVQTHQDLATGQRSPLTLRHTAELNEAAALAGQRLNEFEKQARAKLRV